MNVQRFKPNPYKSVLCKTEITQPALRLGLRLVLPWLGRCFLIALCSDHFAAGAGRNLTLSLRLSGCETHNTNTLNTEINHLISAFLLLLHCYLTDCLCLFTKCLNMMKFQVCSKAMGSPVFTTKWLLFRPDTFLRDKRLVAT